MIVNFPFFVVYLCICFVLIMSLWLLCHVNGLIVKYARFCYFCRQVKLFSYFRLIVLITGVHVVKCGLFLYICGCKFLHTKIIIVREGYVVKRGLFSCMAVFRRL